MNPFLLVCLLSLSLIGRTYSAESKVISKTVVNDGMSGEQLAKLKEWLIVVVPKQSCVMENGTYYNKLNYPFPPDDVVNVKLIMHVRNLFDASSSFPYSPYKDFKFTDNLDGTFNITIAMSIAQLVPAKCGVKKSTDNGKQIIEYNCLFEFKFVGLHDPASDLVKHLIYMTLIINGEDDSVLSFGSLPITDEICPPASCRYEDSIKTQATLCMPNDCTQERNSTALTYGDNFQFLIDLVDPSLRDAFELDLMQILFQYILNDNVDITEQCTKLCNDAGLPCKPGYIVIQCPVLHTGRMVLGITSKMSPVGRMGRMLKDTDKDMRTVRISKELEICEVGDEACFERNIYIPPPIRKEPTPDPEPEIVEPSSQEDDEGYSRATVVALSITVGVLACLFIGLSVYIGYKKFYKHNHGEPENLNYA